MSVSSAWLISHCTKIIEVTLSLFHHVNKTNEGEKGRQKIINQSSTCPKVRFSVWHFFMNRCYNIWTIWHWKRSNYIGLFEKRFFLIYLFWLFVEWQKKRKTNVTLNVYLNEIKLPFVLIKSNFPSGTHRCASYHSSVLTDKTFSCTWFCLALLFIRVNWVAKLCWDGNRSFMSVLCSCFCWTYFCLPLPRPLLAVV